MSDEIEKEIQAKGLTAPRVTPQRINDVIASEHYFTAGDGIHGATITAGIDTSVYPSSLDLLTFCVLTLKNGFTVTGESACASPENFDPVLGRKIARENAVNKVWMLEGYLLKQQLHDAPQVEAKASDRPAHQQRVIDEVAELDSKLEKLRAFTDNHVFADLDLGEQHRLKRQLSVMAEYSGLLHQRIAAFPAP